MNKKIVGIAYVLGDDIDTDQIIPAHHLVYNLDDEKERKLYGRYAMSGAPKQRAGLPCGYIPFVPIGKDESPYTILTVVFGQRRYIGKKNGIPTQEGQDVIMVVIHSEGCIRIKHGVPGSHSLMINKFVEIPNKSRDRS